MIAGLGGNVNPFMAERAEKDRNSKPRPKPGLDRQAVSAYNEHSEDDHGKRFV
jgi:hypothetical protein